jgi:hypothetical protein
MIKAILIKPLDGEPEGSEREFSKSDFDHLVSLGAVKAAEAPSEEDDAEKPQQAEQEEQPAPAPEVPHRATRGRAKA